MANDSDQTIKTTFLVETADAIQQIRKFREEVEKTKIQMKLIKDQTGQSFKDIAEGIKAAYKGDNAQGFGKVVSTSLTELTGKSKLLGGAFMKLLPAATGIGIALWAINKATEAVNSVITFTINLLKQAATSGMEFAQSMFQLSVGINAMRRSGVDITMQDMLSNIQKLRKEYGIFTTQELVKGAAALANLTRSFRFTKDQIFELQGAIVKLALVNGRAMDEVQRTVALALSSGYTEGLQRLGVSINRVTIALKAEELGWGRNYMSLLEWQRAEATRIILMEKTAAYEEDLKKYAETAPGRVMAMKKAWEELTRTLGDKLVPVMGFLADVAYNVITRIQSLIDVSDDADKSSGKLAKAVASIVAIWVGSFTVLKELSDIVKTAFLAMLNPTGMIEAAQAFITVAYSIVGVLGRLAISALLAKDALSFGDVDEEGISGSIASAFEAGSLAADKAYNAVLKKFEEYSKLLDEPPVNQEQTDADIEKYENALKEMYEGIIELRKEYNKEDAELAKEHAEEELELLQDASADVIDAWKDRDEKIADIEHDLADDIADAHEDAQEAYAELERDTRRELEDSNRKYREQQLKAETDFQERMRRLREEFLFDLEDALRERDALQVLNLIRRYKLDVEQETRGYEQNLVEMKRAHQAEIEEIKRNEAEKRAEIRRFEQEQIQDAQEAAAEKRAETEQQLADELAQIQTTLDEKLAAMKAEHLQEWQDLYDSYWGPDGKQVEMVRQWADTLQLTKDQLMLLMNLLREQLGKDGVADSIVDSYILILGMAADEMQRESDLMTALAQQALVNLSTIANATAQAQALTGGTTTTSGTPAPQPDPAKKQFGGTMYANRPTLVQFGEVPEIASFTPLSRLNTRNMGLPSSYFGSGGGGGGIAKIEVWLGAGLEAKIIDTTLGEVAEIMQLRRY